MLILPNLAKNVLIYILIFLFIIIIIINLIIIITVTIMIMITASYNQNVNKCMDPRSFLSSIVAKQFVHVERCICDQ